MKRISRSSHIPTSERRKILEEYESYPRGDSRRGAILRKYGIYGARKPGPVPQPVNPLAAEVARLTRENARLQTQLAQAEAIVAIQKKLQRCWS